jgi:hypothetical protein
MSKPIAASSPRRFSLQDSLPAVLLTVATMLAFGVILADILRLDGGVFSYTTDDAYISLRLSENIHRLHYGINLAEPASPNSSILFPFLLAPAAATAFHAFVPLAVNLPCLLATALVALAILRRCGFSRELAATLALIVVFAFDIVGVAFTGLEHSAHILVSLAVLLGLIEFLERGRVPPWLLLALVLGPLLRFEGMGVTTGALAVLLWRGRWGCALAVVAALALILGGYVAAMQANGLPPLPSSVLAKSQIALDVAQGTALGGALRTIVENLKFVASLGQWLLLLGALLALRLAVPQTRPSAAQTGVAGFGTLAVLAHLVAGHYGSLGRYELYIVGLAVLALLYVWSDALRRFLRLGGWRAVVDLCATLLIVALPYTRLAVATPAAANNVYLQQYQMHRFVSQYFRGPIAANDIGWVSYRNPDYVLDLWGLGSEEARKARLSGEKGWMERLVDKHRIPLVMIFPSWFEGQIPASWQEVAELKIHRKLVSVILPSVSFFATPYADRAALQNELEAFGHTLPDGASLSLLGARAAPPPG